MDLAAQIVVWIITITAVPAGGILAIVGYRAWRYPRQFGRARGPIINLIMAVIFAAYGLISLWFIIGAVFFHRPI